MTSCNKNFLKHKYMGLAFHTMRGESLIFGNTISEKRLNLISRAKSYRHSLQQLAGEIFGGDFLLSSNKCTKNFWKVNSAKYFTFF